MVFMYFVLFARFVMHVYVFIGVPILIDFQLTFVVVMFNRFTNQYNLKLMRIKNFYIENTF